MKLMQIQKNIQIIDENIVIKVLAIYTITYIVEYFEYIENGKQSLQFNALKINYAFLSIVNKKQPHLSILKLNFIFVELQWKMNPDQNKTIKITVFHQLLGNQTFQVETKDNISQFRGLLSQNTPMSLYENYHFENQGKNVPEYIEVGQLFENEAKLAVVIDNFNERSSRYHLKKILSILVNPLIWAVMHCRDPQQQIDANQDQSSRTQNEFEDLLSLPLTSQFHTHLKLRQKIYYEWDVEKTPQLEIKKNKEKILLSPQYCLESIRLSGYNPPPYYRKMAGDFYYLHLVTLEGAQYHITANPQGFYANQSNNNYFQPTIHSTKSQIFTSLMDLLVYLSPKFRQNFFSLISKMRVTDFDKMVIGCKKPDPQTIWLEKSSQSCSTHLWRHDNILIDKTTSDSNSIKDWNELLQIYCILPSDSLIQRINKQKIKYKLYHEFIESAKQGTIQIIQGKVLPLSLFNSLNSSSCSLKLQKKSYVYASGSLLFTITYQSPYNYSQKNSHNIAAAPTGKSANTQLNNLALLQKLKVSLPQIHLEHMVVVKYRGFKVVVQAICPGQIDLKISQQSMQQEKKSCESVMKKICKILQLSEEIEVLYDDDQKVIEDQSLPSDNLQNQQKIQVQQQNILLSSRENLCQIKNFVGNPSLQTKLGLDKRRYLLNLHRLSPRDFNYPGVENQNCILRPQLLQIYKEKQKCTISINSILGKSLKVKKSQKVKSQEQKLKSIAKFAKEIIVPLCINNLCNSQRKYLSDTKGVMHVMHKMGLSSRYLGQLYNQALNNNKQHEYPHFRMIIERVIIIKTLKNIFRMAMRQSNLQNLKIILSRLLNCIFASPQYMQNLEEQISSNQQKRSQSKQKQELNKKKKKKNNKLDKIFQQSLIQSTLVNKPSKYLTIKPSQLWDLIRKIAQIRYFHKLPQNLNQVKGFSQDFKFNKIATLRDLCLNLGLILERRQYLSQNWRCFVSSDILQFRAICKHIPIQFTDLEQMIEQGDKMISKCQVEQAIQSYNRAIHYIISNFGGLHQKLGLVHKKISNIYFRIGQIQTALIFANHSCEIFQTIYGTDHIETIQIYSILGLYHYAKRNFKSAEFYIMKSIHLYTVSFGQTYPEILANYLNLSTIYESQKKFPQAIMSTLTALCLSTKIFGQNHLNTAICHSALAALHYQIPDIEQCIQHQGKAVQVLSIVVKSDDSRLKQSKGILQYYKNLQNSKKVKEVHEKQQRKLAQLFNGMSLFKVAEPTMKEKEQLLAKIQKANFGMGSKRKLPF